MSSANIPLPQVAILSICTPLQYILEKAVCFPDGQVS
jgi:hypothetical protein